jgi:ribosomal-protein-serine acetyltransferase
MTFDNYSIRLIRSEDAEQLLELVTDNKTRISNYLPKTANSVYDATSAALFIKAKNDSANQKEHYCFVIEDIKEHKLSGLIFLKSFDWTIPKCELGYFIDKNKEGQGITSKAVSEIIKFCFNNLKLNRLFLRAAVDNFGSKKVAENNGFIAEGILRKDYKTGSGELIDVVYYGLLKETK